MAVVLELARVVLTVLCLTTETVVATSYTYDANGSLTSTGRWDYTYDAENRQERNVKPAFIITGHRRLR